MRILHINEYYRCFGGAEKYLFDVCSALEQAGHQVVIISSSEKEHISVHGRKEYFVSPSYGLRSGLKMWGAYQRILEEEKPDIIHLHNTHYFVSPLITKKLMRFGPVVKFVHDARFFCPHCLTKIIPATNELCLYPMGWRCFCSSGCYPFQLDRHGLLPNLTKFLFVYWELITSRTLDKMIVGSQYMYDELLRNKFQRDRVCIIPCFTTKSDNSDDTTFKEENKVLLCIGRFDGIKGIPQFIDALKCLRNQDWCAEIVGDGLFCKDAEEKVRQLGLEKKIRFLGRLSDEEIDRCYQRCSIVVMPSMIPESFGLVGIEAMVFGKPVVAFDSGGIREWLVNNETGFLVKRGDIRELAYKISQLLGDESLSTDMGLNGIERVERLYRNDMHIMQLIKIYEDVIGKRDGTGRKGL